MDLPFSLTHLGPQGAYRSTGQSQIVSFSDPLPFAEPYLCAALGFRTLAGFFPLQRMFFP